MASAGLTELHGSWFRNSNILIDLNMNHNSLTILKRADLRSLRNLMYADFSNNQIRLVEEMVFGDLTKLKYLDLRYNEITEIDSKFPANSNMHSLRLSHNLIENVSTSSPVKVNEMK